jgi:hypothetical protein
MNRALRHVNHNISPRIVLLCRGRRRKINPYRLDALRRQLVLDQPRPGVAGDELALPRVLHVHTHQRLLARREHESDPDD